MPCWERWRDVRYDFANILFAGPCNQRCPSCIGQYLDPALNRDNLDLFPLHNLELFVGLLRRHRVQQLVFTGTDTDPQLYHHEERLIRYVRRSLPGVHVSLHTNGQVALDKSTFDMYDRATISFPSFEPGTFHTITGTRRMPDLPAIVSRARIPIKVSCLLNERNAGEAGSYMERCREIGVQRLVFRREYRPSCGETDAFSGLREPYPREALAGCILCGTYRGNPVYDCQGMQVTFWSFERTTSTSLNLFADGTVSSQYLLARAVPKGFHGP
jgi:MoaA/NifB/PqqE/SkfB family radical SAM enzyme